MAHRDAFLLLQCVILLLRVEASVPLIAADAEREGPPPRGQLQQGGPGQLPQSGGELLLLRGGEPPEPPEPPGASALPKVVIDLDLPPKDRFREWARRFVRRLAPPVDEEVEDVLTAWVDLVMSAEEQQEWLAALKQVIRPEQLEELEGVAEEFQAFMEATSRSALPLPFTIDGLLLAGSLYELNYPLLACSGVVVARPDGSVIHGRNLDYVVVGFEGIMDVIEEVVYMRGGKPLYTSVSVGFPYSIVTGMRFGGWTIEQNTHNGNNRALNLEVAKAGGRQIGWELRHILETTPDFSTAVETVLKTNWMAPQYLILSGAGANEGAVITLHRGDEVSAAYEPNYPAPLRITRSLAPEVGVWYLDQTNDEVWGAPEDDRRPFEQQQLEKVGREGMDEAAVMQLLRTPPAFQLDVLPELSNGDNATLFTAVFNLAKGTMWVLRGNETFQG